MNHSVHVLSELYISSLSYQSLLDHSTQMRWWVKCTSHRLQLFPPFRPLHVHVDNTFWWRWHSLHRHVHEQHHHRINLQQQRQCLWGRIVLFQQHHHDSLRVCFQGLHSVQRFPILSLQGHLESQRRTAVICRLPCISWWVTDLVDLILAIQ